MGTFSDFNSERLSKVWPSVVARAVHGDRITMALVEVEPNQPVAEHDHENEQLGFVIDGEIEMKIDGDSRLLTAGQTYVIPSNVVHSAVAGPKGCVVVDVFSPVRADWEAVESGDPTRASWPPG